MYESPITMYMSQMQEEIEKQETEQLLLTVNQTIGFDVNKEELIKALRYDRKQYEKGYKDGEKETLKNVKEEIETANVGLLKDYGFSNLLVALEILDRLISEVEEC